LEDFADDILTIPSGSSTEITGTISGRYVGTDSIAKRFGDIVIICISYTQRIPCNYTTTGTFGNVSGLVTDDEFNNKTNILTASGIYSAEGRSGYQGYSFGGSITVSTTCSNNIISVTYTAIGYSGTYYLSGAQCVVAFKV
jgi:hypothetical protein